MAQVDRTGRLKDVRLMLGLVRASKEPLSREQAFQSSKFSKPWQKATLRKLVDGDILEETGTSGARSYAAGANLIAALNDEILLPSLLWPGQVDELDEPMIGVPAEDNDEEEEEVPDDLGDEPEIDLTGFKETQGPSDIDRLVEAFANLSKVVVDIHSKVSSPKGDLSELIAGNIGELIARTEVNINATRYVDHFLHDTAIKIRDIQQTVHKHEVLLMQIVADIQTMRGIKLARQNNGPSAPEGDRGIQGEGGKSHREGEGSTGGADLEPSGGGGKGPST